MAHDAADREGFCSRGINTIDGGLTLWLFSPSGTGTAAGRLVRRSFTPPALGLEVDGTVYRGEGADEYGALMALAK